MFMLFSIVTSFPVGLLAYFPMNEATGNVVVSTGLELTLSGAEIISTGKVGGALQVQSVNGEYATGRSVTYYYKYLQQAISP